MKDLCDFISSNVKQEHFPYLRRNVYTMEDQLTAAQIDYRNVMPGGNPGELWLVESWSRDHSAHLWLVQAPCATPSVSPPRLEPAPTQLHTTSRWGQLYKSVKS